MPPVVFLLNAANVETKKNSSFARSGFSSGLSSGLIIPVRVLPYMFMTPTYRMLFDMLRMDLHCSRYRVIV